MPEPYEHGDVVASLRIVRRENGGQYKCFCYRCRRAVTVAGSSLRRKKANCAVCYPTRKIPPPVIAYDRRGWPEVAA